MKLRLQLSWIALILGSIWGARMSYLGQTTRDPLVSALVMGYMVWAFYWGVPDVWRWWQAATSYQRSHPASWTQTLMRYLFALLLVPLGGGLYGALGGGLYQWGKALWLTR